MKNKVKKGIIIAVLTFVVVCAAYVVSQGFFTRFKSGDDFSGCLNKAFGDNYKIVQTDKVIGMYRLPDSNFKLPGCERIYEISYKDINAAERHFEASITPYRNLEYNTDQLKSGIVSQMDQILAEEFYCDDMVGKYFEGEADYTNPTVKKYVGEDYEIDTIFYYDGIEVPNLCELDLSSYSAGDSTVMPNAFITLYIYGQSDEINQEYIEKIKAVMEEYDSLSDKLSNYKIVVYSVQAQQDGQYNLKDEKEIYYKQQFSGSTEEDPDGRDN